MKERGKGDEPLPLLFVRQVWRVARKRHPINYGG